MAPQPIRVAVLRFLWAPGPPVPDELPHPTWPEEFFRALFQDSNGWSLRDYWSRVTFGLLQPEFDFSISNWWRLGDGTHAALRADRSAILAACRKVVEEDNGISLDGFDQVVAFVHAPPMNAGAVGGGATLDQGGYVNFYQHEIGHVLGFEHAFGPFLPPPNEHGSLYNDPYCVMGYRDEQAHDIPAPPEFAQTTILTGAEFWRSDRRPSAAALYRRFTGSEDFVDSGWVTHMGIGQRAWLASLSEADNTTPVVAVLPLPDQPSALLTVEYRTNVGDDAGVTPAVVVHSIGVHDVGEGRHEVNPTWFEGTLEPVVGASFTAVGVKVEVMTVSTGSPAGVEVEVTDARLDPLGTVEEGLNRPAPQTTETSETAPTGTVQEGIGGHRPRISG